MCICIVVRCIWEYFVVKHVKEVGVGLYEPKFMCPYLLRT